MVRRIAVAAAALSLVALFVMSTLRDLDRGPHRDEVEHLHTAVRMNMGDRIYVDFAQHHPPLFGAMLMPFVGDARGIDGAKAYVFRARLLIAVITAMAIVAAVFVVWSASGDAWSVVIFVGLLFASGGIWRNGLGDIRPDTLSLAIWWLGAALALLPNHRGVLRGAGLGLIFVAALVIPKWPLMSIVAGVVFLWDLRRDRRALAAGAGMAALIGAAGIGAIACFANLRFAAYHVLRTSSFLVANLAALPEGGLLGVAPPNFGCPLLFRPLNVVLVCALLALAWFLARATFASRRLVAILFALLVASACEIYFVYPYPAVDYRYWVNWAFICAAVFALAVRGAVALLPRSRWAIAVYVVLVPLVLFAATDVVPPARHGEDVYWASSRWLLMHSQPGDTVWMGTPRHPIAAADASYYWYGLPELIPAMLQIAKTESGRRYFPPLTESDLPPCRVERGLDPHVRFLDTPPPQLPVARTCFQHLVRDGRIVSTRVTAIWMVRRPSDHAF